ncbi:unnamed protein product [Discula destructiva]
MNSLTYCLFLAGSAIAATTLPTVTQEGNAFWADGKRFYMRGVAYQPGGAADPSDPLLDISGLKRDIENFKKLGVNTLRIYTIDNSASHDEGMGLLADAGIYLALDVNTPHFSLNRADVFQSYNEKYLQSIFATVDAFATYSNTLLFFSGNEVINDLETTSVAPYIRAVTRDIKNYINARAYRAIPVGYSSADVAENIELQLQYFDCGDESSATDFFAFNDYSWCDPSDFITSGWQAKVEKYSGYNIPMFFSEFGCIEAERAWGEVASIYSTNMSSVFSGGIAYEYSYETNGYGIVEIVDGKITTNEDFDQLADAFAAVTDPAGDGGYTANGSSSTCPTKSADWAVTDLLIPAPPADIQDYMDNGAGTGPGLGEDVTPSQWGGNSYSESNVTMDGVVVASTSNGSSSSGSGSGSSSSSSGSSSESAATSGKAASGIVALVGLAALSWLAVL